MLETNKKIEKLLRNKEVTQKLKTKILKQIKALKLRTKKLETIAAKPLVKEVK
jgi:hypothetical protein|tara:strand:+ start:4774 stop:4932 length:159 start_codon:yes stop_codon:yes gene_type:complete